MRRSTPNRLQFASLLKESVMRRNSGTTMVAVMLLAPSLGLAKDPVLFDRHGNLREDILTIYTDENAFLTDVPNAVLEDFGDVNTTPDFLFTFPTSSINPLNSQSSIPPYVHPGDIDEYIDFYASGVDFGLAGTGYGPAAYPVQSNAIVQAGEPGFIIVRFTSPDPVTAIGFVSEKIDNSHSVRVQVYGENGVLLFNDAYSSSNDLFWGATSIAPITRIEIIPTIQNILAIDDVRFWIPPIDSDGDGVFDEQDLCPGFDDLQDLDADTIPDGCDVCPGFDDLIDADTDGVPDGCDICNGFPDNQDSDGDQVPDGCDPCPSDNPDDSDLDTICDADDICPGFDDFTDSDADGVPDGCDACVGFDDGLDDDGDGVANGCDPCPDDSPDDSDGDGVCNSVDICEGFDDALDTDADTVPDGCDTCPNDNLDDTDGDGVCDSDDLCPGFDDSIDDDSDGVGDACDLCAGTPVGLTVDSNGCPTSERGFFYAIEPTTALDRLYRIDIDMTYQPTTTPIGEEGALGFPAVGALVWDSNNEELLSYDESFDVWLKINTSTGAATPISSIGEFMLSGIQDMTFNPNDGLVYAQSNGFVYAIDPSDGSYSPAFEMAGCASGIAYVEDALAGFSGIFAHCSGLRLFVEPTWQPFDIGGTLAARDVLLWDANTDSLWSYSAGSVNDLYVVNEVSGSESLLADWNLPIDVASITFIPAEPDISLPCTTMDADQDGDIDLLDFAAFQACFTGAL